MALIVEAVLAANDAAAWICLFSFCARCIRAPRRGVRRWNLASEVNRQIKEVEPPSSTTPSCLRQWPLWSGDPLESLAAPVAAKLEEGNFKGAVHLACSEDTIVSMSDTTLTALQQKHPQPHPDAIIPLLPVDLSHTISVVEGAVARA